MSPIKQSWLRLNGLPIRWRLSLLIAAPMVGVVITLSIIQYRQQVRDVEDALIAQCHMTIQSLSRDLEKIMLMDDRQAIGDLVDRLDSLQNVLYLLAHDESRRPVFTYQRDPSSPRITQSTLGHSDALVVSRPVSNQAGHFALVHIGVSREPLRTARRDAIRWNALTIGGLLLVSLLVAYLLQLLVSRPIVTLARFVRDVADSESYDGAHAEIDDRAELGVLKDGIHHLLDCIVERERSLNETILAVKAASELRAELVSHMNHEMRTPLNLVIGYSDLLLESEKQQVPRREELVVDLEQINAAAAHLLELINKLLDLSKIEAGRMQVHLQSTDVSQLIEELANLVRPLISERNNTLRLDLSDDVGLVDLDRAKVRQCLLNLLSNAAKFTDNGTITLSALRDRRPVYSNNRSDNLILSVQDTGIGMTDDQMARIFQPYVQATSSTSESFGGTGLGLAICKQYSELMDGEIAVESAVGEGTTFSITLPIAPAQ